MESPVKWQSCGGFDKKIGSHFIMIHASQACQHIQSRSSFTKTSEPPPKSTYQWFSCSSILKFCLVRKKAKGVELMQM